MIKKTKINKFKYKLVKTKKKSTASGVPRRSPIQVLTRPNVA